MDDKAIEEIGSSIINYGMSDCCSASVYAPSTEWAICVYCKEPCGIIMYEDEA